MSEADSASGAASTEPTTPQDTTLAFSGTPYAQFRRELENTAPDLLGRFDDLYGKDATNLSKASSSTKADSVIAKSPPKSDNDRTSVRFRRRPQRGASDPQAIRRQIFESKRRSSEGYQSIATKGLSRRSSTRTPLRSPYSPAISPHTYPGSSFSRQELVLRMMVMLKLFPVLKLLSGESPPPAARQQASTRAHDALIYARDHKGSSALTARCSYYIGLAKYNPKDRKEAEDAIVWFQRALDASEGGFPEGQRAQEKLNEWESIKLSSGVLGTAMWAASGMWRLVRGSGSGSTADNASRPASRADKAGQTQVQRNGNRIPSFSTWASDKTHSSGVSPASVSSQWSPSRVHSKGNDDKPPGRRTERVRSPEPIPEDDEDNDDFMPNNVLDGLVEASKISPAMQRRTSSQDYSPSQPAHQHRRTKSLYIPPNYRSTSLSAPTTATWQNKRHARLADLAVGEHSPPMSPRSEGGVPRSQKPIMPPANDDEHLQGEYPFFSPGQTPGMKKRNSVSSLLIATGLDAVRGRFRDEAAAMEEGESPFREEFEPSARMRWRPSWGGGDI